MVFGLAGNGGPSTVRVQWPDGTAEAFAGLGANAYHTLRRGAGRRED
ncbi:MAG: ASPIC/UnbV domain-containing protein [Xanthomonadaceae bacterium]|nr:ASPIC/UnbV domain-containing protein [Xanthomonadaceae bacterium]